MGDEKPIRLIKIMRANAVRTLPEEMKVELRYQIKVLADGDLILVYGVMVAHRHRAESIGLSPIISSKIVYNFI